MWAPIIRSSRPRCPSLASVLLLEDACGARFLATDAPEDPAPGAVRGLRLIGLGARSGRLTGTADQDVPACCFAGLLVRLLRDVDVVAVIRALFLSVAEYRVVAGLGVAGVPPPAHGHAGPIRRTAAPPPV